MGNLFSAQATVFSDYCAGQVNNLCNLDKNVEALRTKMDELRDMRNDVMRKVEIAEENHMLRLNVVDGWLSRVKAMESQVEGLISNADTQLTEGLCHTLFCSGNFFSTLKLAQRVADKLEAVEHLKDAGRFATVAENTPAPVVREMPSGPTVGLETFLDKVWSRVHEEGVGSLGLYGMGGVGKSTLLKKINNKLAKNPNGFNFVIWVSVSKESNLQRIQEDIRKHLPLKPSKDREGNALCIYNVLKKKRFVLLLDDLWERIDLTAIGIPGPEEQQKGCKMIMTSRSEEVCVQMQVNEHIEMKCLEWNDAWELFQKNVGQKCLQEHPDIVELAEEVARRCGGLPLALVTVGRAMACRKTPEEWHDAIHRLQTFTSEFPGMENSVFSPLKLSYDYLIREEAKSCFLYCALFLHEIEKEELINYLIGEGRLNQYNDVAKNRGYSIIGSLVNMSLLIEEGNFIKMHDVLREVALWIACKCDKENENVYIGADLAEPAWEDVKVLIAPATYVKVITVAPEAATWEDVKRISLIDKEIGNLRGTPNCPKLLSLHLIDNYLTKISSDFFQFMPVLTVLNLSFNHGLLELPEGISALSSLQYLDLSSSNITRLPIGLKKLKNLKYFDLNYTSYLQKIPKHMLSSLLNLEVLRVSGCGGKLEMSDDNILIGGKELLVEEVQRLERLNKLHIGIRSASALQLFLSHPISVRCTEVMTLEGIEAIEVDISFLENMARLRAFQMFECNCSIKVGVKSYFSVLCKVRIESCSNLRDLTWLVHAPNLTDLYIENCPQLKEIISRHKLDEVRRGGTLNLFGKLENLELIHLESLKIIYDTSLPLPHLKIIEIISCPHLEKLLLDDKSFSLLLDDSERQGENAYWQHILKREGAATITIKCYRAR